MSARFAELMALSAAQTQDSVAATQQIIQEKRRKEEQRKKEQMEKDKRDREFQVRLIKKKLEEQQQAEERKQKQEEDRRGKEELIRQREEEQRRNLVYGKDRRAGGSSGGGARSRKGHGGSDDDGEDVGGLVLTREEKRQRKLLSDLNKSFPSARKGHSSPTSQSLKRSYRAGAVTNLSESSSPRSQEPRHPQHGGSGSNAESLSNIRKKLAAMPPTLMRLGTTKRDVRTIDEIVTDLQKKKEVKVIGGEEARKNGFDWFGEQKKMKKVASVPSPSPSPETRASQSPRPRSKECVAPPRSSASTQPRINGASAQTSERKEPRTKVTIVKPDPVNLVSFSKINKGNNSASTKSTVSSKSATSHVSHVSSNTGKVPSSAYRKRARSDSLSDSDGSLSDDGSPPPVKRRPAGSSTRNDISSEIWKLFGKDRNQYIQNDVFSDEDDDMEADAEALRREEMRSARIAKKEDELAEEEERRHEEEKRRKKKEKERRGY
ncbi:hypothetical protein ACEPAF_8454 [Sanghuangporus sanghuang]